MYFLYNRQLKISSNLLSVFKGKKVIYLVRFLILSHYVVKLGVKMSSTCLFTAMHINTYTLYLCTPVFSSKNETIFEG